MSVPDQDQEIELNSLERNNVEQPICSELQVVKVHSDRLNLDFTVYVQDQTLKTQQRCYIMTVHDLGCDYSTFTEFISCPEMRSLKERVIWLHVDLPGQEANAADLSITKYPTMPDLAEELLLILDHFKINKVVCLGEGCGANVVTRFAMKYPQRCAGVALVHPTGSTASVFQQFKERLASLLPVRSSAEAYLIWHRFGRSNQTDQLVQANIKEFQQKFFARRNPRNLDLLIDAFLNRSNITEKLDDLKVDVLIAYGKKASLSNETKKFYKALYETRKNNKQLLVNCPLLEVEEMGDVIGESPDRLAIALQFFLQGCGLLTAMPMKNELKGLGRLSRAFSMEEFDKPRKGSNVLFESRLSPTAEVN